MFKNVLSAGVLSAAVLMPTVQADEDEHPSAMYREAYFHMLGLHFQPIRMMVQGQIPWDAERAAVLGRDLGAVSGMDILSHFSEASKTEGTKDEIWEDMDDFKEKMKAMQAEAMTMAEVTQSGDRGAVGEQLGALGKSCKSCHDVYREEE